MINTEQDYQNAIDTLNIATAFYDQGIPTISDREWDNLYFQVQEYEKRTGEPNPQSPTQSIQYQKVSELEKVTHNHWMGSLDKTKNWDDFCNYFGSKPVVGMLKLDGLTCSLRYLDGKLVSAETRGNSQVGENILHNALVISSIPNRIPYDKELIVDGEIVCKYDDFESFSTTYRNPRNFAAGSIRLLDSSECAKRKLTFVVWNVVKGFNETNSFQTKLTLADKIGFIVVPWTSSLDFGAKDFLKEQAQELKYPIDGLVGRFDDIAYGASLGETSHHANAAYAFKFYDEQYETELLDIEYGLGRTGQLTPVAIFTPVEIEGTIVEKASLHNLNILKNTLGRPYIGQKVQVAKMNMIIPQILSAEEWQEGAIEIIPPSICPVCGQPVKIITSDSGVETLMCNNDQCQGQLINVLEHYYGKKGLDIKGLSKATLEKLIDLNWLNSPEDIFSLYLHRDSWIKQPGFGEKSVDKILNTISDVAEGIDLWRVISAAGIPLIGSTIAKQLANYFKTYKAFREAVDNKFDFSCLEGFGPNMTDSVLNFDYTVLDKIAYYLTIKEPKEQDTTSLEGLKFAITGKLHMFKNRSELKTIVENSGGKVVDSVSKNTSYLINNDTESNSSKNKAAKSLNIPIITEEKFIEIFLTK